ncbi:MAG: ATP-binding protein [Oscillospiraceae bacterium]
MFAGLLIVGLLRYIPFLGSDPWFYALTLFYFVFQFSVLFVVFEAHLWQKILIFFVHKVIEACVMLFCENMVSFLFTMSSNWHLQEQFGDYLFATGIYALSLLLDFILCYLVLWIYHVIKNTKNKRSDWMLFALIPVSQILLFVCGFIIVSKSDYILNWESVLLLFGCIFSLVGDLSLLFTLDNIRKKTLLEKRIELMEAQQISSMKHLKSIAAITKRQHMINHDFKNQLITACLLLDKKDSTGARESLSVISGMLERYEDKQLCGHPIVNAVTNYKLIDARDVGVELSCELQLPMEIPVSDTDLCSIYANILDNAISALSSYPEKAARCASLSSSVAHGFLLIRESNPYDENCPSRHTDEDVNIHGFGLDILRYITEKYGGWMEITKDDGIFDLQMRLPLTE